MMTMMIAQSDAFSDKLSGVCRLCLREDGPMSSIFTSPSDPSQNDHQHDILAARITSIAQVQISRSDGLPASICHVCRQQVDKFYDFRLLVEISDRKLRSCLDEASELGRIVARASSDGKDTGYEEFTVESAGNERNLLSVNAILVPSESGMQVWQICNVEDGDIVAESRKSYTTSTTTTATTMMEETAKLCSKLEYPGETDDSEELDDFEGVKRCLAQTVAINATNGHEDQLYFTTGATTSSSPNEDQNDDKNPRNVEFADDGIYEEEHLLIPEEFSCQLCLKSFPALDALKIHVSDHSLSRDRRPPLFIASSATGVSASCRKIDDSTIDERLRDYEAIGEISERLDDNAAATDPLYSDSLNRETYDETFVTTDERLDHGQSCIRVDVSESGHGDDSFAKSRSLKDDEKIVDGATNPRIHRCEECGREFAKRSELRYHKGTHTDTPSTCTVCDKRFRNVQSFKMHLKRHTLGSRYNCHDCGKSYYTNSELARHVQQHTGLREYPCALCEMSFLSRPELNRHVKYHNGTKMFECKICRKTYYESGHLKVHERVHTGERPFACTVCEKGFITKSKLARHFKIHERANRDSEIACERFNFVK